MLKAGHSDAPRSRAALEGLCQSYWFPLYAFVRRYGHSPEDAEDLTQEFFAQLLAHNWVGRADPDKGRFGTFLLTVMKRFLGREWGKAKTLKRGGQARIVPLHLDTAETRYGLEPANNESPEGLYEKQWALTLLQTVLNHLRESYAQSGKAELFERLEPCLIGGRESQPYKALAEELGMTEGAARAAVCRLRERYRKCLKDEVAQTVRSPSEVDEELRHLLQVLAAH